MGLVHYVWGSSVLLLNPGIGLGSLASVHPCLYRSDRRFIPRVVLQEAVNRFLAPVQIGYEKCVSCNKTGTTVVSQIAVYPRRLAIKVSRFLKSGKKIEGQLEFNSNLELGGKLWSFHLGEPSLTPPPHSGL